jgi:hypothetical protein
VSCGEIILYCFIELQIVTAHTVLFLGLPPVSEYLLNYVESSRTENEYRRNSSKTLTEDLKNSSKTCIEDVKEQFQNAYRRPEGTVPKCA